MEIKFKYERLKAQFMQLTYRCRCLIYLVHYYSVMEFNKGITITSLIRTKYGVHCFGRGADLSSKIYTKEEREKILKFINQIPYDKSRPKYKTIMWHGKVKHFHLQVRP